MHDQLVAQHRRLAVVDLRPHDHRIDLGVSHIDQPHPELLREQRPRDLDETQVGDVVHHGGAIGVEKHHLHFGGDGRSLGNGRSHAVTFHIEPRGFNPTFARLALMGLPEVNCAFPIDMISEDTSTERPIVFINFWREGGMRHYSESLVHALGKDVPIHYLRSYEGETGAPGEVLNLDGQPLRPRNLPASLHLAQRLRALNPRAVHLNNEQPALLSIYPLLARMNSVITIHDARSHSGESFAKRLFHQVHLRMVAQFVRKIIVHSAAIRDALPPWIPRERVHLMPHVNYNLWASSSAPTLPESPLTVLFFGRILAYKGLDVLLEAFRRLDPARFRLIIAGEGEVPPIDLPNVEVDNRFVTDDRIAGLFQRSHVIAVPYHAASQSGVAHMAFAFGKPVIATNVGALPDIVHHEQNGLLIPPGDAAALAAALERMTDPSLRAKLAASIDHENSSSDAAIRERLLAIYDV